MSVFQRPKGNDESLTQKARELADLSSPRQGLHARAQKQGGPRSLPGHHPTAHRNSRGHKGKDDPEDPPNSPLPPTRASRRGQQGPTSQPSQTKHRPQLHPEHTEDISARKDWGHFMPTTDRRHEPPGHATARKAPRTVPNRLFRLHVPPKEENKSQRVNLLSTRNTTPSTWGAPGPGRTGDTSRRRLTTGRTSWGH